MANPRSLTDDELEEVYSGALVQLADSVREYNQAERLHAAKRPTPKLAEDRLNIAKESIRVSLHVYHSLREQIE
jgi:hypothetical protein